MRVGVERIASHEEPEEREDSFNPDLRICLTKMRLSQCGTIQSMYSLTSASSTHLATPDRVFPRRYWSDILEACEERCERATFLSLIKPGCNKLLS